MFFCSGTYCHIWASSNLIVITNRRLSAAAAAAAAAVRRSSAVLDGARQEEVFSLEWQNFRIKLRHSVMN